MLQYSLFTHLQELESEQLQRRMFSESSDSEDDGPTGEWQNALTGRMRGVDDDGASSSSEGVAEPLGDGASTELGPYFC